MKTLPTPAHAVEYPPTVLPSIGVDEGPCTTVDALFDRMQQNTRIVQDASAATTKQHNQQEQIFQRSLDATIAKITAAKEERDALRLKVRDTRARASEGLAPQIISHRRQLQQLNQSDSLIAAERNLKYRQEIEARKHQALQVAMEQDRLLACEELEAAYEALRACETSLGRVCVELEISEREEKEMETEAAGLSVQSEQAAEILTEALTECERVQNHLHQQAAERALVELQLQDLAATAEAARQETLVGLAKLGFVCARVVQKRKDCGHQNPKQKIHKMLAIELENMSLRKENFELRTELVDLVKLHYGAEQQPRLPEQIDEVALLLA